MPEEPTGDAAGSEGQVEMVEWKPAGSDVAVQVPKDALKEFEGRNERWKKVTTREQAVAEKERLYGDPEKLKAEARREYIDGLTADDWKAIGKDLEFLPGEEQPDEGETDPRDKTIAELKEQVEKLAQSDEQRKEQEQDQAWIAETDAKFKELAGANEDYAGYQHDLGKSEIENRYWDILANVEGATPQTAFDEALKAQIDYDKSVIDAHQASKESGGDKPPGDSAGAVATPPDKFLRDDGTLDEKASSEDLARLVQSMTG